MGSPPEIFDRRLLRRRRAAAADRMGEAGFLHRETAGRLLERLADVARNFDTALAIGWDAPCLPPPAGSVIYADLAPERACQAPAPSFAADEEWLPVRAGSLPLILSNLTLHWINDLPGTLLQINHALRPDGLFLAAMFGGDTLGELNRALLDAELELFDGAAPRVSPMAEIRDVGGLLQRAGFVMPVVDAERIEVSYADPFALMRDLRAMGETNTLVARPRGLASRRLFLRAAEIYGSRHADGEGRVRASFEILFLAGWAPGPEQPKPRRPGSATARLADALGARERRFSDPTD